MATAVVICPGRGTYNAAELGYLAANFGDEELLSRFEAIREAAGQEGLRELDGAERFSASRHSRGENAAALIFAASLGDFRSIDRSAIEVVAVTGNSMGWYTALACAGATSAEDGFGIANSMGSLMHETMIGGQLVHPWVDEDWTPRWERRREMLDLVARIAAGPGCELYLSIDLGGMLVLAGNEAGLGAFEASVEGVQGRFPMRLARHSAFHTPLQEPVAQEGRHRLPTGMLRQPELPMIDGAGRIWWPGSTDIAALYRYTLGEQVTTAYDFSLAVRVAAREFAPDLFVVPGPGTTLGGAVAQSLILANWRGMSDKAGFEAIQEDEGLLVAMARPDQRSRVARS